MNKIYYKAKIKETNEWVEGDLIHLDERTMIAGKDMSAYDTGNVFENLSIQCVEVDVKTICIGCVIDGVLFFENDIYLGNKSYEYFIKFENGAFYAYHTKLKDIDNVTPLRWGGVWRFNELGIDIVKKGNLLDDEQY